MAITLGLDNEHFNTFSILLVYLALLISQSHAPVTFLTIGIIYSFISKLLFGLSSLLTCMTGLKDSFLISLYTFSALIFFTFNF